MIRIISNLGRKITLNQLIIIFDKKCRKILNLILSENQWKINKLNYKFKNYTNNNNNNNLNFLKKYIHKKLNF